MPDIKQIIVPVDFHQHTDELVAFAIDIAKKLGAKPTFINVIENVATMVSYSEIYPASYLEIDKEIQGYAKKMMAALLEKNKQSI
jgi:nucleotide-binding universal stress UspA family protein